MFCRVGATPQRKKKKCADTDTSHRNKDVVSHLLWCDSPFTKVVLKVISGAQRGWQKATLISLPWLTQGRRVPTVKAGLKWLRQGPEKKRKNPTWQNNNPEVQFFKQSVLTVIHSYSFDHSFSLSNYFFFSWPDLAVPYCATPKTTDPLTTQPYNVQTHKASKEHSVAIQVVVVSGNTHFIQSPSSVPEAQLWENIIESSSRSRPQNDGENGHKCHNFLQSLRLCKWNWCENSWSCSQPGYIDAHVCLCLTELKRTG